MRAFVKKASEKELARWRGLIKILASEEIAQTSRRATAEYVKNLALLDKLLEKSKLTENDALKLSRKINHAVAKRHRVKV